MLSVEPASIAGGLSEFSGQRLFLRHGELADLMRTFAWTGSPLGPPEQWPQALRTAVRIMLTSRQPIWIGWGEELSFLYNDPYRSIIGGKHPWALGRPTSEVWHEIWHDIGPMLAQAMHGDIGTYVEAQLLIMERNGYPEETYYTFSYSPIPTEDGSAGGIFCANTDDTRRVIGERQLALLRELAAATASARTWQQVCTASARALASNPRDLPFAMIYMVNEAGDAATLAGLTGIEPGHPAAPTGLPLQSDIWPLADVLRDHRARVVTDLAAAFETPFPYGAWDRMPTQAVLQPIPSSGDHGRPGVLIAGLNPYRLFDDDYAGFIELAVGQIAAAVAAAEAYEQERRRAEALAEVDRAKTTFFSNVSHEFRTPLTLMLGPLEELLATPDSKLAPTSRDLVTVSHRNGLRLLKLVNTLLDFSRIEAGRVQASFRPVDLSAITAELASTFQSATDKADLRLGIDCAPLPQPVFVDRDMWEKVILNLVSNAFKFTLRGEIGVTVRPSRDGFHAEILVSDTGTGIPATDLPHLFERFRRVEGARGRSFEGSGIGLALVHELVKLHGGRIEVTSEIDRGSVFAISLPFGTGHLPAERVGASAEHGATGMRTRAYVDEALAWLQDPTQGTIEASSSAEDLGVSIAALGSGERVLLVDDNLDMRRYVQRLLETAGFSVEGVADGIAALESAGRARPDLVLSDIMMPRLDGFGLLGALRQDPSLRAVPVLLLSARAGEEEKLSGLSSGADDYLVKPFSARELIARVRSNLQLARARADTERALQEEANRLRELHSVSVAIAAELNLERVVQMATDAATRLSGAAFGSFLHDVSDQVADSYLLDTLPGAPRSAFADLPMPPDTAVFAFRGEGIVRSCDITSDPRFGQNAFCLGMPEGHLPVRSYLAAPVKLRSGAVIGGLFLGHPEPGAFGERAEQLVGSIAIMAAIAIEKITLYGDAQREIEQRKQIEAELRDSEQTLEHRVAERTAELATAIDQLRTEARERERAESALRQAQKMEGIGQLTGGVAHDFNNLLTVIIGNVESIQRQVRDARLDPARITRSAEFAMRGARRAEALTQRLLAFSRQQPLDPKSVDLGRLVTGMSDLLQRTIGEQITVETVLAGSLWRAFVDPNQIEVAILNLAVNARDAMPDGGKLTIETTNVYLDDRYTASHTEVSPGQYAMLAISDTGVGMPPRVVARAFEPFFTTKDVGHGTGLGLSQVYGFVKQSGGHVKIYSEVGIGTTVKMYLPRLHSDEPMVDEDTHAPSGGTGNETILVVEDDNDVRAYTTETLRELGYRVLETADGTAALRMLQEHPDIALLFTDVGLPKGMNGRQLAEAARTQHRHLKVLFTTGYARNAIVHDGRLDAGVDLITKPFQQSALACKLRDILDARSPSGRVLVVEDEVLLQELLADCLQDAGLRVDVAGSATAAIAKLRLIPGGVDAAIIDIGLPDRRGDLLVRELRALYPSLPILIATGADAAELERQFTGEAGIMVIGKPYAPDRLISVLREMGVR